MLKLATAKGVAVTVDFHASLITFEGTRHNWRRLVAQVNRELRTKGSPCVTIVSGDRYTLPEIGSVEVILYQAYISLLSVNWKRHITRSLERNKSAPRQYFDLLVEVLSGVGANVVLALRRPHKFRKRALRVLNISELHRQAISAGLESGAKWMITLEDDGLLVPGAPLGMALDFILDSVPAEERAFFDISDSFSFEQLGVEHVVSASDRVHIGTSGQDVVRAAVPFTNTVCATALSRGFALKWSVYMERSLKSKVLRLIPIDWHLNRFILKEPKENSSAYFHFDPGLIRQGSIAP